MVEHPLREVVGSNPSCAIPKALKMVPGATLLGVQHYKASTGFSSQNTYRTTNSATLAKINKSKKSHIIFSVCIHRRTVWKTGRYAKYVNPLKYRDYYYWNEVKSNLKCYLLQCLYLATDQTLFRFTCTFQRMHFRSTSFKYLPITCINKQVCITEFQQMLN